MTDLSALDGSLDLLDIDGAVREPRVPRPLPFGYEP